MYLWIYFFSTDIIKLYQQNSYSSSSVFEIVSSLGQQVISFFFLHIKIITATSQGENIKSHPITIGSSMSRIWVTSGSTHQSYPDVALIGLVPYKLKRQIISLPSCMPQVWRLTQCFSDCL